MTERLARLLIEPYEQREENEQHGAYANRMAAPKKAAHPMTTVSEGTYIGFRV